MPENPQSGDSHEDETERQEPSHEWYERYPSHGEDVNYWPNAVPRAGLLVRRQEDLR